MLSFVFKLVVGIVALAIVLGILRTMQLQRTANQARFVAGTIPSPMPSGFYKGSVNGPHGSWLGKHFDSGRQTGINVFDTGGDTRAEQYPFKSYTGQGVTDPEVFVMKIDYDMPTSPFWMRPILDEIVQIGPEHYLGKLQVRILPGFPFTLAFFELSR